MIAIVDAAVIGDLLKVTDCKKQTSYRIRNKKRKKKEPQALAEKIFPGQGLRLL